MNVREVEICSIPALDPGQMSLLNMHTLLNILNVLRGELSVLGITFTGDPDCLHAALARCDEIIAALPDPVRALQHAAEMSRHEEAIFRAIAEVSQCHPDAVAGREYQDSMENLRTVFRILEVRAREIMARAALPERWVETSVEELRQDFMEIFAAIEKNSHGRYHIIYNLALQGEHDYYVDFEVESENGASISLPSLVKDVMRDLIANARKYTAPGGTISAGIYETKDSLCFSVQDTGRGIPPDELETVVHYGRRGSNVGHVRTMGGGFGLTKAFLVTKQFGGRFWIRSGLGVGTRVRLEIPRPGTR